MRVKFNFWAIQPVFHTYDIHHWLNPAHVINTNLPNINKYVKPIDVETICIKEISQEERTLFVKFICENFQTKYSPDSDEIFPYFSTLDPSYLSVFLDDVFKSTTTQLNYRGRDVIGLITSRPLFLTFQGKSPMNINYFDNLSIRADRNKKDIESVLIQTHHYNIRHINNKKNICLFKHEGIMKAIVPLTMYTTAEFNIIDICGKTPICLRKIVKIDKKNFIQFKDMIKMWSSRFKCTLNIDQSALYELINKDDIAVYMLIYENNPIGCYVLRRNLRVVGETVKCIDLISAVDCSPNKELFFNGFQIVCKIENKRRDITRIKIEGVCDNCQLLTDIQNRGIRTISSCPSNLFLYNYVSYTITPGECLFIY